MMTASWIALLLSAALCNAAMVPEGDDWSDNPGVGDAFISVLTFGEDCDATPSFKDVRIVVESYLGPDELETDEGKEIDVEDPSTFVVLGAAEKNQRTIFGNVDLEEASLQAFFSDHYGCSVTALEYPAVHNELIPFNRNEKNTVLELPEDLRRRLAIEIPDAVDYTKDLPPVKHQNPHGSCATHAFVATIEYKFRKKLQGRALSERFLYQQRCRKNASKEGNPDCESENYQRIASYREYQAIEDFGVPLNSVLPYHDIADEDNLVNGCVEKSYYCPKDRSQLTDADFEQDSDTALRCGTLDWDKENPVEYPQEVYDAAAEFKLPKGHLDLLVTPGDFDDLEQMKEVMKRHLYHFGVAYMSTLVYTGGEGCDIWVPTSRSLGGHAMAGVGYTDEGVLIRNSWGQKWCDGGVGLMTWEELHAYSFDWKWYGVDAQDGMESRDLECDSSECTATVEVEMEAGDELYIMTDPRGTQDDTPYRVQPYFPITVNGEHWQDCYPNMFSGKFDSWFQCPGTYTAKEDGTVTVAMGIVNERANWKQYYNPRFCPIGREWCDDFRGTVDQVYVKAKVFFEPAGQTNRPTMSEPTMQPTPVPTQTTSEPTLRPSSEPTSPIPTTTTADPTVDLSDPIEVYQRQRGKTSMKSSPTATCDKAACAEYAEDPVSKATQTCKGLEGCIAFSISPYVCGGCPQFHSNAQKKGDYQATFYKRAKFKTCESDCYGYYSCPKLKSWGYSCSYLNGHWKTYNGCDCSGCDEDSCVSPESFEASLTDVIPPTPIIAYPVEVSFLALIGVCGTLYFAYTKATAAKENYEIIDEEI